MMSRALLLVLLASPLRAAEPDKPVARLGSTRLRHTDQPLAVAFSPDGTKLYSGGKDGVLRVWSVATGESLAATTRTSSHILSLTFVQNNKRLAALYSDGGVYLLDPETLDEKHAMPLTRPAAASLSADAAYAAVLEELNALNVYDVKTGLQKLELPEGSVAAMSPDGTAVAAADTTGSVTLYRTVGGKPTFTAFHGTPASHIAFRADGKRFSTASERPGVRIWEPGREKPVLELADAAAPVLFVGTNRIAALHKSGVGLFDPDKNRWVKHIPDASGLFAVSQDGTKLAAIGGNGHRVRLWNLDTGEQLHAKDDRFANAALLLPAADGKSLFGVGGTQAFRWSIGETKSRTLGSLPLASTGVTVGGGRLFAMAEKSIWIWDDFDPAKLLSKEPRRTVSLSSAVTAIAVSADGKLLAASDEDKHVELIDAARGKKLRTLPISSAACEMIFTADGSKLVMLGRDGWLRAWRFGANEGEAWKHRLARNRTGLLAASPDGKLVAAATATHLAVLDASTGESRFSIEKANTEAYLRGAVFTADGRHLITGTASVDGLIQIWDVQSQSEVKRIATGGIVRLAASPDGRTVFTAGEDETIAVWKVR